jgi:hypothetical protein
MDGQTDLTKVTGAIRDFCEDAWKYDVDMIFSGVIVLPNLVKISQLIMKSNRSGHKHIVVILSGYSFSFKKIWWTRKPPYFVQW